MLDKEIHMTTNTNNTNNDCTLILLRIENR